jgi:hypothetical protein
MTVQTKVTGCWSGCLRAPACALDLAKRFRLTARKRRNAVAAMSLSAARQSSLCARQFQGQELGDSLGRMVGYSRQQTGTRKVGKMIRTELKLARHQRSISQRPHMLPFKNTSKQYLPRIYLLDKSKDGAPEGTGREFIGADLCHVATI